MEMQCTWKEKLQFTAQSDGHSLTMDTVPPLGSDTALSPKHLLLGAICGCTGMDIVSLLSKYKQEFESLEIDAQANLTKTGHPIIFEEVQLTFKVTGSTEASELIKAINLSQTKYCGVSAMVSKATPISYSIELNGENIGSGKADFSTPESLPNREEGSNIETSGLL